MLARAFVFSLFTEIQSSSPRLMRKRSTFDWTAASAWSRASLRKARARAGSRELARRASSWSHPVWTDVVVCNPALVLKHTHTRNHPHTHLRVFRWVFRLVF